MKILTLALILTIVGCEIPSAPTNQGWDLKYNKLFDQPVGPPDRPPLPDGWVATDTGWLFIDTTLHHPTTIDNMWGGGR